MRKNDIYVIRAPMYRTVDFSILVTRINEMVTFWHSGGRARNSEEFVCFN